VLGRPKIEFDDVLYSKNPKEITYWLLLDNMCTIHCTLVEIAYVMQVSEDTIERRIKEKFDQTFADYFKKASSFGKTSLRRVQFEHALKGSIPMMIWLGKQCLGQSDQNTVRETRKTFHLAYDPDAKPE